MSAASDRIRTMFKAGDDARDAGLTTPDDVIRYDDIIYGKSPAEQILDVYRPKNGEGKKLPVIVSVHGGGWVYGDKDRYQYYCMSLAQQGFAVINFTYRLAPENRFPASLEDTNLVIQWMLDNAAEYGFDTGNVFAVGDSAGASLLGLYISFYANPAYAAHFDFKAPEGFKFKAVAFNCGAFDQRSKGGETNELMKDLLEEATPEALELVSVIPHVSSAFPPAYIMTALGDFLKMAAPAMAAAYTENNVPFVYRVYGTQEKPLGHVFHCNMRLAEGARCNQDECEFFKEFL